MTIRYRQPVVKPPLFFDWRKNADGCFAAAPDPCAGREKKPFDSAFY